MSVSRKVTRRLWTIVVGGLLVVGTVASLGRMFCHSLMNVFIANRTFSLPPVLNMYIVGVKLLTNRCACIAR